MTTQQSRLKPLHGDETLIRSKLKIFEAMSSDALLRSLMPTGVHCLKTRADGTMLDGHHRIYVLRARGVDVDALEREVIAGNGGLS